MQRRSFSDKNNKWCCILSSSHPTFLPWVWEKMMTLCLFQMRKGPGGSGHSLSHSLPPDIPAFPLSHKHIQCILISGPWFWTLISHTFAQLTLCSNVSSSKSPSLATVLRAPWTIWPLRMLYFCFWTHYIALVLVCLVWESLKSVLFTALPPVPRVFSVLQCVLNKWMNDATWGTKRLTVSFPRPHWTQAWFPSDSIQMR